VKSVVDRHAVNELSALCFLIISQTWVRLHSEVLFPDGSKECAAVFDWSANTEGRDYSARQRRGAAVDRGPARANRLALSRQNEVLPAASDLLAHLQLYEAKRLWIPNKTLSGRPAKIQIVHFTTKLTGYHRIMHLSRR
jgi:hypothetical protein